jgi:Hypothetical glycosyl hydrolase family 15
MRLPKLSILTAAAILLLMFPAAAAANVAGQFRVAIGSEASFPSPTLTAQRNSYIVLQAWEASRAAELKAANPNLQVLVYQNLSSMAQGTSFSGLSASGVNYAEANTAHPEWFLLDTDGSRIAESGYSWLWMADVGNPGYQQQWTDNVLKLLADGPWDGVMMDDTNTTAKYDTDPDAIAKYPTDAAYQAAMRSILAYAGPRIQAAGKLAIPNIGSWSEYPEVAKEWLRYVSGGIDEMFAKWSTTPGQGYRDASGWQTQIEEIQTTEQMGKRFLAVTQAAASDTQAIRYGWASVLLGADGNTAYAAAANYTGETWSSEYEAQIGEPTSRATRIGGGAWERTFSGGLVLVNPTTGTVEVNLGGTYSGSGLTDATSATMAPNTGLILQGAAAGGEKKISGETGSESTGETSGSSSSSPGSAGSGTTGGGGAGSGTTGSGAAGSAPVGGGTAGSGSAGGGAACSAPAGSCSAGGGAAGSGSIGGGTGRQSTQALRRHRSTRTTMRARVSRARAAHTARRRRRSSRPVKNRER